MSTQLPDSLQLSSLKYKGDYAAGIYLNGNHCILRFVRTDGKKVLVKWVGDIPHTTDGETPYADAEQTTLKAGYEIFAQTNAVDFIISMFGSSTSWRYIGQVNSVEDLKTITPKDGDRVMVKGYFGEGTPGGGEFRVKTENDSIASDSKDVVNGWVRVRRSKEFRATEFGAVPDKFTDSTGQVQDMLTTITTGLAIIDPGVKYTLASLTIKPGVQILDMSGWDGNSWTAAVRFISNSTDGLIISSASNANLNLNSNNGLARAKVSYSVSGTKIWESGMSDDSNRDWHVLRGAESRYRVVASSQTHAWNVDDIVEGVDYHYGKRASEDHILRYDAVNTGYDIIHTYYHGPALTSKVTHKGDGSVVLTQNGKDTIKIADGVMTGALKKIITSTANVTLTAADTGAICTTDGATSAVTVTLPVAVPGMTYDVLVGANYSVSVKTGGTDLFRNGKATISNSDKGSWLRLVCAISGYWEMDTVQGTWAS